MIQPKSLGFGLAQSYKAQGYHVHACRRMRGGRRLITRVFFPLYSDENGAVRVPISLRNFSYKKPSPHS